MSNLLYARSKEDCFMILFDMHLSVLYGTFCLYIYCWISPRDNCLVVCLMFSFTPHKFLPLAAFNSAAIRAK